MKQKLFRPLLILYAFIRRTKPLVIVCLFIILSFNCFAQKTNKLNVYFKFDKYDLDSIYKLKIDSVVKNIICQEIKIEAHCDSFGSNKYNDKLSLNRALAVKQYFATKNLRNVLINTKALGKRNSINNNSTKKAAPN